MATDIVNNVDAYAHSKNVTWQWTLRRKVWPRRWVPDLGNGAYVKEARNSSGMLCFLVKFPNGKECTQDTLASAQEYAEELAPHNLP